MAFFIHLCGALGHFMLLLFATECITKTSGWRNHNIPSQWLKRIHSSPWSTAVPALKRTTDITRVRAKPPVSILSSGVNCISHGKHFGKFRRRDKPSWTNADFLQSLLKDEEHYIMTYSISCCDYTEGEMSTTCSMHVAYEKCIQIWKPVMEETASETYRYKQTGLIWQGI